MQPPLPAPLLAFTAPPCRRDRGAAGRVVFGWMTDHMGITALTMFQCSTFVTGVSTALVPLAVGSSAIYVYSILFGLFAGAFIALMPVFVAEELSPKAVRRGMSVIYTVQTPSGAQRRQTRGRRMFLPQRADSGTVRRSLAGVACRRCPRRDDGLVHRLVRGCRALHGRGQPPAAGCALLQGSEGCVGNARFRWRQRGGHCGRG